MKYPARILSVFAFCLLASAFRSPAPLTYQPGEGWSYETPGKETGKWQRPKAREQLEVAQAAFDKKDYSLALKAALRVERVWPLSDFAPKAQFLVGRCYEELHNDEKAFNAYQRIIEHNPKAENYQDVLQRQYLIANRYLGGQWFKLFNYIPFFPSMDKTADMYQKIIKSGPYSDVAAQAQLKIGEAREKQADPKAAVKAYEVATDRYNDRPEVAADALFKTGLAYKKQAKSAEYDHNVAAQAIAAFTDFITLFPKDARVPDAQKFIAELKTQAARGSFSVAEFYAKNKKWQGALVYYNDAIVQDPNAPLAETARQRIDQIKRSLGEPAESPAPAAAPPANTETATPPPANTETNK